MTLTRSCTDVPTPALVFNRLNALRYVFRELLDDPEALRLFTTARIDKFVQTNPYGWGTQTPVRPPSNEQTILSRYDLVVAKTILLHTPRSYEDALRWSFNSLEELASNVNSSYLLAAVGIQKLFDPEYQPPKADLITQLSRKALDKAPKAALEMFRKGSDCFTAPVMLGWRDPDGWQYRTHWDNWAKGYIHYSIRSGGTPWDIKFLHGESSSPRGRVCLVDVRLNIGEAERVFYFEDSNGNWRLDTHSLNVPQRKWIHE